MPSIDAKIAIDPVITSSDSVVDRNELREIHETPSATGAGNVTLILQDSGLDTSHPTIQNQTGNVEYVDFTGSGEGDAVGHGTFVGDEMTRYLNGPDVVVNRIFGSSGSGGFEPIEESFEWILDNADRLAPAVLNMSWGANGRWDVIDNYVNEIASKGIIPVAASGNSGGSTGSPATARYCVGVGALQENGERMTNFSSWDQDSLANPGLAGVPDVCAVGKNVLGARAANTSMGTIVNDQQTVASGTSMAAPVVSSMVADLLRRDKTRDTERIVRLLERTAVNISGTTRDGLGRVQWDEATNGLEPETVDGTVWSIREFGNTDYIQLDQDVLESGEYTFDVEKLKDAAKRTGD